MKKIIMPFDEYEDALIAAGIKGENHAAAQFIKAMAAAKSGDQAEAVAILSETFNSGDAVKIVNMLEIDPPKKNWPPTPGSRL